MLKSLGCKQPKLQIIDEAAFVYGIVQLIVILMRFFRQAQYLPVGFLAGNVQLFPFGHGQQKHLHAGPLFGSAIQFRFHVLHEAADVFFGFSLTPEDRQKFLITVLPVQRQDGRRNGKLPAFKKGIDEPFLRT